MGRQNFVYPTMRTLCATPEFGDQLFDMLTPVDLSALLYVFNLRITNSQSRRYMQLWRQFFVDKQWALWKISQGFEISFVGNDLTTLMHWIKCPQAMDAGKRSLYVDLRIVSPVASRRYPLQSYENCEYVIQETRKHHNEFAKDQSFNQSLEHGIRASYSELIMGKDLCDDHPRSAWLNLTVTSAIKYRAISEEPPVALIRAMSNMSTALWYGQKSMHKWQPPKAHSKGSSTVDVGLVIEIHTASCLDLPLRHSLSYSWTVLKVVECVTCTGAYIFQKERLYNCLDMIEVRA